MESPFHGLEGLTFSDQILFNQFGRGSKQPTPFETIHEAFEHIADKQPNTIAAEQDGRSISYYELERAANRLANRLISMGLKPRQRVCLVVQRSLSMVVAMLAVLKAGCQYVPLDGQVTAEEALRHVIEDVKAPFILCLEKFHIKVSFLAEPTTRIVIVDDHFRDSESPQRPGLQVSRSDGAYAIYTSSSTGSPKGVDVSHGNVTNLLLNSPGNLAITEGIYVAQLLSISFDMGQWEILGCLINGGTLLIRTNIWEDVLKRAHTIISTPSILGTIKRENYPNIRTVALAGEPCPNSVADDWSKQATVYNCCGPPEVTIVNTMHRHSSGTELCIGKPIPNTNVYILDEDENPAPIGKTGLMWVGGAAVSRGYLNLPELTASRYKYDRFANDGSIMFNTRDLCRWRPNGSIAHEGRADDQVNIKGFRVELDSVSASMEAAPSVWKACAIFSDEVLWGFYSGSTHVEEATVKAVVEQRQPYYAVPSKFVFRSSLPITSNGKVDKRALLASVRSTPYTPPASPKMPETTTVSRPAAAFVLSGKEREKFQVTERLSSVPSASSSATTLAPEKFPLPAKKGRHGLRALRHRIFSLYRRLFSVVFIANLLAVYLMIKTGKTGKGLSNVSVAVAANLTMAVLMRQEYVINALFTIACAVPTSWPLWARKSCAKVYHIGGIHSGCAISSLVWLIVFTVWSTIDRPDPAILTVSYLIVALMLAMVVSAHPTMRMKHHDRFEMIHRFAGWTALVLFWAQTVVVTNSFRGRKTLGSALRANPGMWLLATATLSVALPWMHLRKVRVRADVLSAHAVRLYFTYAHPVAGSAIRISERPLLEWHAFATIAKPNEKGFSVIVSNAGDWTSRQIKQAPTKIWVRGIPACGVARIVPLFRSVVLVATGSGIGPLLPHIYAQNTPCRIFWSAAHPEQNFGSEIIDAVKQADPRAVIHDTRTQGRPDMAAITYRLYRQSRAEAVVVISNKKLTQMVVYAMESRGIPAFGAIFDS
ncbi:hypothetical protein BUE80_DR011234 [Diplocarpon rosae]|nr:hypothetical protein BUE80_DR011234 [Diplocarpon rosae]